MNQENINIYDNNKFLLKNFHQTKQKTKKYYFSIKNFLIIFLFGVFIAIFIFNKFPEEKEKKTC